MAHAELMQSQFCNLEVVGSAESGCIGERDQKRALM
ncbi:MAG: hypothetical protein N838_23330 [Thiohalocapsa sp. PB-PSB1]|nr:MAG: hypothetical protein N838_23330 [Thiohalocapsa sp. PB-PSB1]